MIYNTIIIGSGISGIFTLKHLKECGIHDVIILDKNDGPFGVWNVNNEPSVFENTYCVSSKLYMTISDFPMPENVAEFPHHSVILDYYKKYAEHFDLYKHIKNKTKVVNITKKDELWNIQTTNETYQSKNVVIATGTVNDCPNIPNDSYYKHFTGEMYHSRYFDKIQNVKNKKILIVGGSDTAMDCAMYLKDHNDITISIKNGVWFQSRMTGANDASDMFYSRAFDFVIKNIFSKKYFESITGFPEYVERFWGTGGSGIDIWKPKCQYLNSYYVKSREIIEQISKGIVHPENGIINIEKNKIYFETGNSSEYDIILFCTGYTPTTCMDFLDKQIVNTQKYKHIFYAEDPSIMFVGFIRPYLTSIPMISELQSRWVAKSIKGEVNLPTIQNMIYENQQDSTPLHI